MKKRWFLAGMLLLLVPLLTVGCGVAQEQYDAVVADLNQASKELQSVRSELQVAQANASELTSSLEKTRASLRAAEAENSELTSSLEKAESELQAGSAELTASVQKSQAELEAAQVKVSELTSSLEKVENELETTKSEYEAFKSEVESLFVLSLDQHVALQKASGDAKSAFSSRDYGAFKSADSTAKGILADLNDVKADRLRSLWNSAYDVKQIQIPEEYYYRWEYLWLMDPGSSTGFDELNREIILAIREVLSVYYHE